MTARRPPAPVEAGRPIRAEGQLTANPTGVSAPPIFEAELVKHPGWQAPSPSLRDPVKPAD